MVASVPVGPSASRSPTGSKQNLPPRLNMVAAGRRNEGRDDVAADGYGHVPASVRTEA
jgi:hypothetical protein